MNEVTERQDVSPSGSVRPDASKTAPATFAVKLLLAATPEHTFLHRLAQACTRIRVFTTAERAAVYGDPGTQEVSGGHGSESEED